jgi:hypothetical protein
MLALRRAASAAAPMVSRRYASAITMNNGQLQVSGERTTK